MTIQEAIQHIKSEIYDFETGDWVNYIDIDNITPERECEKFVNAVTILLQSAETLEQLKDKLKQDIEQNKEYLEEYYSMTPEGAKVRQIQELLNIIEGGKYEI